MSLRGLLVLLVLLAVAVAMVLWVDRPTPENKKEPESLGSLLPGKLQDVSALELERGATSLRLERNGEHGWRLVRPLESEADPRQVKALFEQVTGARIERVVAEKASDLKPFGLSPPDLALRIYGPEGQPPGALALGRTSPVGTGRYASVSDGKVVLVAGVGTGTLEGDAESFREHRLLPVEPDQVQKVSVERPSGRLTLVRRGSEWRMLEPVDDMADGSAADSLVRSLASLAVTRVLDGSDLGSARESLSRPTIATSVLTSAAAYPVVRFEIASSGPADQRYAHRTGSPLYGAVAASSAKDLERDAGELRDRTLVVAQTSEVREVRLQHGEGSVRAWREKEGESWSVQEGTGPVQKADSRKVEDLLDRLRWLRASSFESGRGAAPREREVVLQGDQGELGRLWIANEAHEASKGGGKCFFARSSWRPGIVFHVPAESLGDLPRKAADLAAGTEEKTP